MRGEQAIFNLDIMKKSGLSINPDIHHSKVFSSDLITNLMIKYSMKEKREIKTFKKSSKIMDMGINA